MSYHVRPKADKWEVYQMAKPQMPARPGKPARGEKPATNPSPPIPPIPESSIMEFDTREEALQFMRDHNGMQIKKQMIKFRNLT